MRQLHTEEEVVHNVDFYNICVDVMYKERNAINCKVDKYIQ